MASNHPLPTPAGYQQQRPAQRERAKSSFSFRSNHSHKSSGSGQNLHETHEEKQSRRLTTKADPSMAITEAEPCEFNPVRASFVATSALLSRLTFIIAAVASGVKSSLAPIRAIQHRDSQGNPIGASYQSFQLKGNQS